jgi:N-dimethylarginine dimethylaminohydrolase
MELVCSREEEGADVWPPRQGDQKVAEDLARVLGPNVLCRRSDLFFDGGDFAADGETVFVRPAVVIRNLQRTVATREELIENLENWLGRRVVLLEGAPDHHVAMYMMPVGNKTVLVGDPRMAQHLLAESPESRAVATFFPGGPDFTETAVARFEAVADHCRSAGYQVVRIPLVPGNDGRTFLTYVNALIEQRAGRRIVYLPVYPFAETLNRAAASIWANLGYEVRTVQCDTCACHFGTLHCLVNVLRRQ